MNVLALILDLAGMLSALAAAWLWYLSSRRRLRRISRSEVLDYHDLNRIVTSINRNNLLNGRAALAAGLSALALAVRFAADMIQRY